MAQLSGEDLKFFMRTSWTPACGKRVRQRRKALRLSLDSVGELAGASRQTVSRVELGQVMPGDALKLSIAGALGCDASELWPWPTRERLAEVAGEFAA